MLMGSNGDHIQTKDSILLMQACENGCTNSASILYVRYKDYIQGYIRQRVHDVNGDEEDLAHVVFEQILAGKCHYNGDTNVRAYLTGITRHVIREYVKVHKRAEKIVPFVREVGKGSYEFSPYDPLQNAQTQEIREHLATGISQLPPKTRRAVKLVYLDGLQPFEAAQQLGCDIVTFRQRLHQALKRLKEELTRINGL